MRETILREISAASSSVEALSGIAGDIEGVANLLISALEAGGTVHFAGNGGSAADAQHLAAELSGRYLLDRRGLAAQALTTNTSALTAIANDLGYEEVFARQIEATARPGDVVVLITTSGASPNIVHALARARERGCRVVAFTGPGGRDLAGLSDASLVIPGGTTPHIQEAHITAGHIVCGLVEAALADA
jgi:D-sedoheptulose 7-phosphate isomerase